MIRAARAATGSAYEAVIIVTRKTDLDELTARFATASQARFYIEHADQNFEPVQAAHDRYYSALREVRGTIPKGLKTQVIDRSMLPQFTFGKGDLVVTIGQDGLVSNTAKYLSDQPILAVNPDPALYDGVLLPFTTNTFATGLRRTLDRESPIARVTLARTDLSDGQKLLAFNDFFVGASSHVSARYTIESGGISEFHSSSGIIVSTGAGSSGWLQSIYRGAAGVVETLGGNVIAPRNGGRLSWDEECLVFAVREPFPSKTTGTSIVYGTITPDEPLRLTSHMGRNGVIFSDGIESDYLQFNRGASATISIAPRKAHLILAECA